jgi:hypothetical protein
MHIGLHTALGIYALHFHTALRTLPFALVQGTFHDALYYQRTANNLGSQVLPRHAWNTALLTLLPMLAHRT